ncbi:MAG: TlpA family protein disulfide reductase [Acidobacteriota bacterium]|nr:TlpA family protein disulfide reductase [Acidobacteriota bacterium]
MLCDSEVVRLRVECSALTDSLSPFSLKSQTLANLILLVVMLLACFTIGCTADKTADTGPTPVLSGAPSTTFPMPPLNANSEMGWLTSGNQRARLADYRGQVLVLDFYATWCVPCRESIPQLMALQQRHGAEGLQIIGLNVGGPDDRVKVAGFQRELGIQYPLGFPDQALTDLFLSDDQAIPQTFIFGRKGELVKRFIGYQQSTAAEIEKTIQQEVAAR